MQIHPALLVLLAALTLPPNAGADAIPPPMPRPVPADEFMAAIARHCGQAYAGRITANEPASPNDPFDGKALVMHVRTCTPGEVRIPFHVGEDRSRTWVLTRTASGLLLKHDHRHADGTEDVLTMYGGNNWAMEIEPGVRFVYELARTGRLFRVEFDLSGPIPNPPPP
jgi:hypothetical protein